MRGQGGLPRDAFRQVTSATDIEFPARWPEGQRSTAPWLSVEQPSPEAPLPYLFESEDSPDCFYVLPRFNAIHNHFACGTFERVLQGREAVGDP